MNLFVAINGKMYSGKTELAEGLKQTWEARGQACSQVGFSDAIVLEAQPILDRLHQLAKSGPVTGVDLRELAHEAGLSAHEAEELWAEFCGAQDVPVDARERTRFTRWLLQRLGSD